MGLHSDFIRAFGADALNEIYQRSVVLSPATGIDNLNHKAFWRMLREQVDIASRKVKAGKYGFTKYKLKLISKGRNKAPREISIPTIRDRLVLKALSSFLFEAYKDDLLFQLPQLVVRELKGDIGNNRYDGYIKLDVENFYPSIDHGLLIRRLMRRTKSKLILGLVSAAIKNPTVSEASERAASSARGVPQGLSISNVLAAIYLSGIDRKYASRDDIRYFRYVDDVLILCPYCRVEEISARICKDFGLLGLSVHEPARGGGKSSFGRIGDQFDYLGYRFLSEKITVRDSSVKKLKESLVSIFTGYRYARNKSLGFLQWRINLRVTGCIFGGQGKGWLFFYSEIDDMSLLYELDRHVGHQVRRLGVDLNVKSFVRAYHDIKYKRHESRYFPNFDMYSDKQQASFLAEYFGLNVDGMPVEEIRYAFGKRISSQTRELLTDIQGLGSGGS